MVELVFAPKGPCLLSRGRSGAKIGSTNSKTGVKPGLRSRAPSGRKQFPRALGRGEPQSASSVEFPNHYRSPLGGLHRLSQIENRCGRRVTRTPGSSTCTAACLPPAPDLSATAGKVTESRVEWPFCKNPRPRPVKRLRPECCMNSSTPASIKQPKAGKCAMPPPDCGAGTRLPALATNDL